MIAPHPVLAVYSKRWIILTIYIVYASLNMCQWIQYAIISETVMEYYGVTITAVNWSANIFTLCWPVFVLPVTYVMDKMGLRAAGLIGAFGSSSAAFIKLFSTAPNLFPVAMIGQAFAGVSQLFIVSLPPTLAVNWFRAEEVATACALCFFGLNLGTAMGFLIPPTVVHYDENHDQIGVGLFTLNLIIAGISIGAALSVIFYFPKRPPLVPNYAMHYAESRDPVTPKGFLRSVLAILKNGAFVLHMVSYGINVGIFTAFGIWVNNIVLHYFGKNAHGVAGWMGMLMIFGSMAGSIVIGLILYKNHEFKATIIVIFFSCAASMGLLLLTFELGIRLVAYTAITIFGFFLGAYLPTGIETAIELTFPSPESTVTGLTYAAGQFFGLIFATALEYVNASWGARYNMVTQIVILVVGGVLTCFVPESDPRQEMYRVSYRMAADIAKDALLAAQVRIEQEGTSI